MTRAGMPVERHGTTSGYRYWRCRCDDCREANRQRMAVYLAELRTRPIPIHAHGKAATYRNRGCRCDRCREAHMEKIHAWLGPSLTELRRRNQEGGQPQ